MKPTFSQTQNIADLYSKLSKFQLSAHTDNKSKENCKQIPRSMPNLISKKQLSLRRPCVQKDVNDSIHNVLKKLKQAKV